jgi:hypothetical protein
MKRCFECGSPAECDHHVVPRSMGGTKTVPLCESCHSKVHSCRIVAKSELTKRGHDRCRSLDAFTAIAGLVEMAADEGIDIEPPGFRQRIVLTPDFLDFAKEHGWDEDASTLKSILNRLREIHQTDRAYYAWILHGRPIGTDVRYPWVGLVQHS